MQLEGKINKKIKECEASQTDFDKKEDHSKFLEAELGK